MQLSYSTELKFKLEQYKLFMTFTRTSFSWMALISVFIGVNFIFFENVLGRNVVTFDSFIIIVLVCDITHTPGWNIFIFEAGLVSLTWWLCFLSCRVTCSLRTRLRPYLIEGLWVTNLLALWRSRRLPLLSLLPLLLLLLQLHLWSRPLSHLASPALSRNQR